MPANMTHRKVPANHPIQKKCATPKAWPTNPAAQNPNSKHLAKNIPLTQDKTRLPSNRLPRLSIPSPASTVNNPVKHPNHRARTRIVGRAWHLHGWVLWRVGAADAGRAGGGKGGLVFVREEWGRGGSMKKNTKRGRRNGDGRKPRRRRSKNPNHRRPHDHARRKPAWEQCENRPQRR
jgi:hypothetical protein